MQTKPIAAALLAAALLAGCATASSSTTPPISAGTPGNALVQPCVLTATCTANPSPPPCPTGFARDAADPWGACKDVRHQPCPAGYTGWQNTQYDNCLEKPN